MNRNDRIAQRTRQAAPQGDVRSQRDARGASALADSGLVYRDEYGVKMYEDDYQGYKTKEAKWKEDLTGYETQLSESQAEINKTRAALNKENKAKSAEIEAAKKRLDKESKNTIDSAYRKEQRSWLPVRVVNGNKIEQTYMIPKSALGEISKGFKSYFQGYVDGGRNYNIEVQTKGGGGKRGKELHKALGAITTGIKSSFYEKAAKPFAKKKEDISKNYKLLNKARQNLIDSYNSTLSKLYGAETDIKSNQQKINLARTEHQTALGDQKAAYEAKLEKRRALLTG